MYVNDVPNPSAQGVGKRRDTYSFYSSFGFWRDAETLPARHRMENREHDLWCYRSTVYMTDDLELTPEDVLALINEQANKRRLKLEKAHALQAMTEPLDQPKRRGIPQPIKLAVWQRDGGRCVECGSNRNLEFDHIIPVAMGGANTERNIQLLCEACNRRKGASLG